MPTRLGPAVALAAALACLAVLPSSGSAASGCTLSATAGFGEVVVQDDSSPANGCGTTLIVGCTAGTRTVTVTQAFNGSTTTVEPDDQGQPPGHKYPCDQVSSLVVLSGNANDTIDSSGVTRAAGYTNPSLQTTLDGGPGTDTIIGSEFGDRISQGLDGGSGTLLGGDGNDRLIGDSGSDSLLGGNGDDTLFGLGGEDIAQGGDGNDTIVLGDGGGGASGDTGDDLIRGGAGNDVLSGGDGNDTIAGREGNDQISGDAGDDQIAGQDGADAISGGDGADSLSGGDGPDKLAGLRGPDRLFGGAGADQLRGGPGRDLLRGGPGKDLIRGGPGKDGEKQ